MDWSELEVELTVSSYFQMLEKELTGVKYSKAEFRRALLPLLNNRSAGSVEFKHQNISATLIRFGHPYIKGYLPRYNYQKLLEIKVLNKIQSIPTLDKQVENFISSGVNKPNLSQLNFDDILVDPPKQNYVEEPPTVYNGKPIKTNYLEKEQKNAELGQMGEELVLEFEKYKLKKFGHPLLARNVIWVSKEEGDGLGYDILSKNPDGSNKYIEVKSTRLGKETPFYFSSNELIFSKNNSDSYHLYRLFDFRDRARMFVKSGSLGEICSYTPTSFKGHF